MGGGGGGPVGGGGVGLITGLLTGRGMSICARKIFRPLPWYLVSSLAFNQSYRSEGSRERHAVLIFLPRPRVLGGGGVLDGAATLADGLASVGDEPPELNIHRAMRMTASTIRATAAISLVRFSAPSFT
jgi:hypothetical protein